MKVVFLRHAKAFEVQEDPERKLTPQGKEEAIRIGNFLQQTGWNFKEIITSPVKRAIQTAEILGNIMNISVHQKLELKPNQAFTNFQDLLLHYSPNESIIMVLHMPDIGEICAQILKIPSDHLFFSTGAAIGINLTDFRNWNGVLIFLHQPDFLKR